MCAHDVRAHKVMRSSGVWHSIFSLLFKFIDYIILCYFFFGIYSFLFFLSLRFLLYSEHLLLLFFSLLVTDRTLISVRARVRERFLLIHGFSINQTKKSVRLALAALLLQPWMRYASARSMKASLRFSKVTNLDLCVPRNRSKCSMVQEKCLFIFGRIRI